VGTNDGVLDVNWTLTGRLVGWIDGWLVG